MNYSDYIRTMAPFVPPMLTPSLVVRLVRRKLDPRIRRPRCWRNQRHLLYRQALNFYQNDPWSRNL